MTDVDLYFNFVLHAILGRLGEADALGWRVTHEGRVLLSESCG